ncbi:MAG: hypothetical protein RI894_2001 [Bacteroidota bacterium]
MPTYIAKTFQGLENTLAQELTELGATNVTLLKRGVSFEGDTRLLYEANLWCRTALRILVPITSFSATNEEELYNLAKTIKWDDYMAVNDTFMIDSTVNSEVFTHSHYVSLKLKDALCDWFRDKTGKRPNVNTEIPTLRIHIHISGTKADILLDSSGEALFRRGYRPQDGAHEAPINEVLAAGLILMTGWRGETNFYDPFCGTGTFLVEAAMIAKNIAPNRLRYSFAFHRWKNFNEKLWNDIRLEANRKIRPLKVRIEGSDNSPISIEIAEKAILRARLDEDIDINLLTFKHIPPRKNGGILITNPPYGERLDVNGQIKDFYREIGDCLKLCFIDFRAFIICSNMDALRCLGLRPSKKTPVFNGKLECQFAEYELYQGTKRTFADDYVPSPKKNPLQDFHENYKADKENYIADKDDI